MGGAGPPGPCASAGLCILLRMDGGGKEGTNRRATGSQSCFRSFTQAAGESEPQRDKFDAQSIVQVRGGVPAWVEGWPGHVGWPWR